MTIEGSWLWIENRLYEYSPAAYASLPPAADSDAVRVAERQCGLVSSGRKWRRGGLFVEMAPGDQRGRIGAHAHGDGGRFDDLPQYNSLRALLSWAAQALSDGSATDVLGYVLTADEQGLPYWEDADAEQDGVSVAWDMAALENRCGGL
ncbi:hypothetical protein ACFVAG_03605 [Streptomyces sp. NPDC057644]|uniref:hypothetical protein n=1 Tax=Streptomyces sp. NPDC057644 TaxID=3346191 RepID=UPI0036830539